MYNADYSAENSRRGPAHIKEQSSKANAFGPVDDKIDLTPQFSTNKNDYEAPNSQEPLLKNEKKDLKIFCITLRNSLNNGELRYFKNVREKIKELKQIAPQDEKERKLKEELERMLKTHKEIADEYQLYRQFVIFILIAAFKTAETIIHRLADTPLRKLNRRFKYGWSGLKYNSNGTVSHNFIHNVGNIPSEYVRILEDEAPQYMGKFRPRRNFLIPPGEDPETFELREENQVSKEIATDAPYFEFLTEKFAQDAEGIEGMALPETMSNDTQLNDIYKPTDFSMSPCGVHDGTKLRTDCVICKAILPDEDRQIEISKALLRKINVTENLLKFLAIQQDKRKERENGAATSAR